MSEVLVCPICGIFLSEPYIRCAECPSSTCLCLQCFSKGREFEKHKNNHSYSIVRNNLAILHNDWMASEEIKLLNAVADHGIGNWIEIAKDVGTKNKLECQQHYLKHYIQNPVTPLSEDFFHEDIPADKVQHPMPVVCNTFSEDPPRPVASIIHRDIFGGIGYMPARGDFTCEYNDFAELDIKELAFEDDSEDATWNDLQMAVLDIYRNRLKERARRKWIIKSYGMLSQKRIMDDIKRYMPLGSAFLDHMKPLMHLFKAEDFYKFLEGYLWEFKTKQRIQLLQQCREAGVTRPHSISTFVKLKRKREELKKSKSSLDEILTQLKDEVTCQQYIRKQVLTEIGPGRRAAPPINIAAMSGYELLSSKEKELCSNLRIFPSAFLSYKNTLLSENRKLGSLRLANARSVIKIDVNKTRKIYDLLLEEGLITKG